MADELCGHMVHTADETAHTCALDPDHDGPVHTAADGTSWSVVLDNEKPAPEPLPDSADGWDDWFNQA